MKQNNIIIPNSVSFPWFSIEDFRFRPFDRSSRICHEFPAEACFDQRTDFILYRQQQGIALFIYLRNHAAGEPGPLSRRAGLDISLVDYNTGIPLWSQTVFATLLRGESVATLRVDIPLKYSQVNAHHDYTLSVLPSTGWSRPDRGVSKTLRFFDFPRIMELPTRWFDATEAWIETDNEIDGQNRFRRPGADFPNQMELVFRLDVNNRHLIGHLCQLEMKVYLPDGAVLSDIVEIVERQVEDYEVYEARGKFYIQAEGQAPVYVELCCMGHAFTGFVFRAGCEAIPGILWGDSLGTIYGYKPIMGELRLSRQESFRPTQEDDNSNRDEEDDLDKAIDKFIAEELEALEITPEAEKEEIEEEAAEESSPEEPSPVKTGMEILDGLTGLEDVKSHIRQYTDFSRFQQLRKSAGLPVITLPLHSLFLGSPGTGKTTIAKIMGQLMKETGVLSSGHVVFKERSVLLGQNYNSESEKTLEALKEAQGGILFIDEAYQLHQPQDPRDPGRFVIETLMTALADESNRDWMLILAGYTEPMLRMLDLNPGLSSRIPSSNHYTFADYTPSQLLEIATKYLSDNGFMLTPQASSRLLSTITADHPSSPSSGASLSSFGNARYVLNLIQTRILPAAASRILPLAAASGSSPLLLSEILPCDIPAPSSSSIPNTRRPLGFRA